MFLDTTKITADTVLSCAELSAKTLQVLLCSLIYIHCCGVTIASLFPLSYKTSVCIQSHVAMFRQKGILLHPTRADCYYRTLKLDANRSLQSYGVCENDTLVFHDRELCACDWQRVIRSLQDRIEELEKRVEEDEEVIGVLSSALQKPLPVCCEYTCLSRALFVDSPWGSHPVKRTGNPLQNDECVSLLGMTTRLLEQTEEKSKRTKPSCLSNPTTS